MDREAVKAAVGAFLRALGHTPEGELAETPELVAAAWCDELLSGEGVDAVALLREARIEGADGMVVLRDVAVDTMCPHHLLPAHGSADIAFVPGSYVAGFGAIVRALAAISRRLTLQERIGSDMTSALVEGLEVRGALCRLRMRHSCLASRGPRERGALIETLSIVGSLEQDSATVSAILGR